mgnify:FL=1
MTDSKTLTGKHTDIAGITSLMNPARIKTNVNLEEAERDVIGISVVANEQSSGSTDDPMTIYADTISLLKQELGIDIEDGGDKSNQKRKHERRGSVHERKQRQKKSDPATSTIEDLVKELDLKLDVDLLSMDETVTAQVEDNQAEVAALDDGDDFEKFETMSHTSKASRVSSRASETPGNRQAPYKRERPSSQSPAPFPGAEDWPRHEDRPRHEDQKRTRILRSMEEQAGAEPGSIERTAQNAMKVYPFEGNHSIRRPAYQERMDGEPDPDFDRRQHIDSVMNEFSKEARTSYSALERQKMLDTKTGKIEQIIQIMTTLKEANIDCSSIKIPPADSSIEEIDSVLYILQLKNDRDRYATIAEELMIGFAENVIERVFDGKRKFPIVGAVDYTDYHTSVAMKMYRMRGETSQIVGQTIQKYNIGPGTRILLDLLPGFFLYPTRNRKKKNIGLKDDPAFNTSEDLQKIRSKASRENQDIDDVKKI